ncbi:hypothetical protein CERSUDRAFT_80218 [Gelatoporia subvermispora B]|uniref:Uncharacterized protein n=1 Tax=Ceriporiopsis subvermispora (strain B) TaxID=914234 RepID=M2R7Z9_CERS8|nr:hypothetical protein CERSUDRAFT_80218 [Gelatoporia subvermispora B]
MATPAPNPRASLLSGLRTGGVRSVSGPNNNAPHTAAPAGMFSIPRIVSTPHNDALFPPEEEDELSNMVSQNLYMQNPTSRYQQSITAAVDGSANRFSQQQAMGMGGGMPYNGMNPAQAQAQLQALQLQMMQVEIARLQAIQAQQYQEQLIAQAQLAQQAQRRQAQQQAARRAIGLVPPATAGPTASFDLRSAASAVQMRRANQVDQLRSRLGMTAEEQQVPMTAAIGGKFGSRVTSARYDVEDDDFSSTGAKPPSTPSYTTVISGGTSLGSPASNNLNGNGTTPSKSDAAVSWRRSNTSNSMLGGSRAASSPTVKITPPPGERVSPTLETGTTKARPSPLQFSPAASQPLPATVAVEGTDGVDGADGADGVDGDDSSSVSSKSNSSPSTPHTASSAGDAPPLSPREEASKKLYEGLGIGRTIPTISVAVPQEKEVVVQRLVSHPVRQPRGPPSNNEELLPKNFATRSRRKAIGALGALMGARERREVEAF